MCSCLGRTASLCFVPSSRYSPMNPKDDDVDFGSEGDALLWSRDLEKHSHGEFSFAIAHANKDLEDQSQVETGRDATFVGVYDGHGGPDASTYICDHLFNHLLSFAREDGKISEDTLGNAFRETENGFLTLVRRDFTVRPAIAAVGSCCLAGVIWNRTLYIANLGDSRAVLGYLEGSKIVAEQLTKDHNACKEEVRKELMTLHADDPQILVMKQGVWRIKGIIQISRSIGDAYLKSPEFALGASFPRFHLPEPLREPVLRSDPAITTRNLQPNDKYLIFASDGLWEHLTNQDAVEIVHNNSRVVRHFMFFDLVALALCLVYQGIARRLVLSAVQNAARVRQIPYDEIKKLNQGVRRHVHDDITVVVLFIDHDILDKDNGDTEQQSVRGFVDATGPSNFTF